MSAGTTNNVAGHEIGGSRGASSRQLLLVTLWWVLVIYFIVHNQ
jgi:hypothetical protein